MGPKPRLVLLFASAAFIAGAISTLVLWELFHGPRYIDMVTGSYGPWLLVVFPFAAAALAAFWASFFKVQGFGIVQGALVALLTFVTFCTMLNALNGGGIEGLLALLLAASVFFGWALVLVGAAIGWFVRRSASAAL